MKRLPAASSNRLTCRDIHTKIVCSNITALIPQDGYSAIKGNIDTLMVLTQRGCKTSA